MLKGLKSFIEAERSQKKNKERIEVKTMNRHCPICFSEQKKVLYKQNFHNKVISLMDSYDVVLCNKCGFAFADKIPTQEKFSKYYAEMSKYEFNSQEGKVSDDAMVHFAEIVKFLEPYLAGKQAKILDIGCATGALLSVFKSKGYSSLHGIDPSPSCVQAAQKLYSIKIKLSNIADFKAKEKFDLIILSAIMEHLIDFNSSIEKISSLMDDNGLLFIEVPDAERFADYIYAPFQQFSIEHVNYFSNHSITNLLSRFSLRPVKVQQHLAKLNMVTDPDLFVLAKKSKKNKKEQSKTGKKDFKLVKDLVTEPALNEYIAKCSEIEAEVKKLIADNIAKHKKIIVWGVGTHTLRLIGSGLDLSKVLFFVDSNKRYLGKKLNGIDIISPKSLKQKKTQNIPILISTYSYQEEIAKQIKKELKLSNEIIRIYGYKK